MKKIPFNIPPYVEGEEQYVNEAIASHTICGDNAITNKCEKILEKEFSSEKIYLTTSGTSA